MKSSIVFNYEKPPVIEANAINLKLNLKQLASEFGIEGDIDIDNGHSFTYQIQVFFPAHFQNLVHRSKFDLYDALPMVDEKMEHMLATALQPAGAKKVQAPKHSDKTVFSTSSEVSIG